LPSPVSRAWSLRIGSAWPPRPAPPDDVLDSLAQAVFDAQRTTSVQERFTTLGMLVPNISRQEFTASLKSEADFWYETVQRGKISIE
jgi:hypothetical protein